MTTIVLAPNWTIVGLVYDIVGAIFLAYAIFLNSPGKIAHQAGTYWNSNPFAVRALAEQTVDARSGLIILVAGFVLQMVGQWRTSGDAYAAILLLFLSAFVVAHFAFLRTRWTNHLVSRVKAYDNKAQEPAS